jgi:D-amino-acid dehydrogenase
MSTEKNIVIIGGGAIGMCAAYYLNQAGHTVTVVDKGQPGQACSLHNAGYLAPSHFVPLAHPGIITQGLKWMLNPESPFYIKPRLNLELISWVLRFRQHSTQKHVRESMVLLRDLGNASLALFEEMAQRNGMDFGLQKKGLLTLYNTDRGRRGLEHEAKLAKEIGVEARMLNRDELHGLEPGVSYKATGGLYFPGDAHIVPADFVAQLHSYLHNQGVVFHTDTEVIGVERTNGKISSVVTATQRITGDEFILATGSWSSGLAHALGITLPLQAGKGYSITVKQKPPFSVPMILTEARVAITPFDGSMRFAGTMELAGLNLTLNQRRIGAIMKAVPQYLEGFDGAVPASAELWSGLRPLSPDGLPYIGRFRKCPNLIAATGHAMIGITLATITGKLVAGIANEQKTSIEISKLLPDRFNT